MRFRVCAAIGLLLACGCSKSPSAPPIAGPTRFLVFSSDRDRPAGSFRNYFATLDGGGASQFSPRSAAGVVDRHPTITQDGRILAYQGSAGRGGSQDVFLYNRSTNQLIDDANVNTTADETDPCISLDGTRLAFVRDTVGGRRIRLYDLASSRFIPLANLDAPDGSNDSEPALDAQGRRMVFTTNRNGSSDLIVYQVSIADTTNYPALQSGAGDVEASLSGDGRYVAFASNRAGGAGDFDLYLFDLNTGLLVPLPSNANSPQSDRDPTISQDGTNIIFVSTRVNGVGGGGTDLWNLNRIAAVITQPTGENSPADDLDPAVVWP